MKRVLAAAALTVAAACSVMPASAAPSGQCDGKVDVACRMDRCVPDYPCTPQICLVWYGSRCLY